jgi:hypothetical protein
MRLAPLATLCLFSLLNACTSTPVQIAGASAAHREVSEFPPLQADKGRIYFFRSAATADETSHPSIMLDGSSVGDSKPGGFFFIDGEAGSHEVATSTMAERKLIFTLAPGEVKYVRTPNSFGITSGWIAPELINETEALKELSGLSYTGHMSVEE